MLYKKKYQSAGKVYDDKTNQVLYFDTEKKLVFNSKGELLDWNDFKDRTWAIPTKAQKKKSIIENASLNLSKEKFLSGNPLSKEEVNKRIIAIDNFTTQPDITNDNYLSSTYEDKSHRAYYDKSLNTISVPALYNTQIVNEYPHAYQAKIYGIPYTNRWAAIDWYKYDKHNKEKRYADKNAFEYEAHALIQPVLSAFLKGRLNSTDQVESFINLRKQLNKKEGNKVEVIGQPNNTDNFFSTGYANPDANYLYDRTQINPHTWNPYINGYYSEPIYGFLEDQNLRLKGYNPPKYNLEFPEYPANTIIQYLQDVIGGEPYSLNREVNPRYQSIPMRKYGGRKNKYQPGGKKETIGIPVSHKNIQGTVLPLDEKTNIPYINLPEFEIKAKNPYPYKNQLSKIQLKYFNSNTPIGRSVREIARNGKIGNTANDLKTLAVMFGSELLNQAKEATGIPAAIRTVREPLQAVKAINNTLNDAIALPIALPYSLYNYSKNGSFDIGKNPLTNEYYGQGLGKSLDALSLLPVMKGISMFPILKKVPLNKAYNFINWENPLNFTSYPKNTSNFINIDFKKIPPEKLKDAYKFLERRQFIKNLQKEKLIGEKFTDLNYAARSTEKTNALTKKAIEAYNTAYRRVSGTVPKDGKGYEYYSRSEWDMSKPAYGNEISEFQNMINEGVDFNNPLSIAEYQATHIPMQEYGYRSTGMGKSAYNDFLFTSNYPSLSNEYGNFLFKLKKDLDFNTGNYQDWYNNYIKNEITLYDLLNVDKFNNIRNASPFYSKKLNSPVRWNKKGFTIVGAKGQKVINVDKTFPFYGKNTSLLSPEEYEQLVKYIKEQDENYQIGWKGLYNNGGKINKYQNETI